MNKRPGICKLSNGERGQHKRTVSLVEDRFFQRTFFFLFYYKQEVSVTADHFWPRCDPDPPTIYLPRCILLASHPPYISSLLWAELGYHTLWLFHLWSRWPHVVTFNLLLLLSCPTPCSQNSLWPDLLSAVNPFVTNSLLVQYQKQDYHPLNIKTLDLKTLMMMINKDKTNDFSILSFLLFFFSDIVLFFLKGFPLLDLFKWTDMIPFCSKISFYLGTCL